MLFAAVTSTNVVGSAENTSLPDITGKAPF